jgi:hypothetical protein
MAHKNTYRESKNNNFFNIFFLFGMELLEKLPLQKSDKISDEK